MSFKLGHLIHYIPTPGAHAKYMMYHSSLQTTQTFYDIYVILEYDSSVREWKVNRLFNATELREVESQLHFAPIEALPKYPRFTDSCFPPVGTEPPVIRCSHIESLLRFVFLRHLFHIVCYDPFVFMSNSANFSIIATKNIVVVVSP
jgi:hypothetical protein